MASRLLRRSGVAVGLIMDMIKWKPDAVYQVGVGGHHEEVDVLLHDWPGTKFYGCEPHPSTNKGLRDNYPGKLYEVAISDHCGEVTLYSKHRHKDGSSLFPHVIRSDERYDEFKVKMTTLDVLFGEPEGKHVLLWVDCEGSELAALQGGERFIKGVEIVNVELASNPPGMGWCKPTDVHWWLLNHGFLRQWQHTDRLSGGQCDAVYVRTHLFHPEFSCCPCMIDEYEKRCNPKETCLK